MHVSSTYRPQNQILPQGNLAATASYTFSAKEKDSETHLSYFGARYYTSDLSIWLSVDPMSAKYPSLSSYTYCADNPVRLVDPNGEELIVIGEAATEAFKQLQASTSLLLLRDEETGIVTASGKCKYNADNILLSAINDKQISVCINAINGNENDYVFGGSFMGSEIENRGEFPISKPFLIVGGFKYVTTKQTVDPYECAGIDEFGTFRNDIDGIFPATYGSTMLHEVTESYLGGQISLQLNTPLLPAIEGNLTYKYYEQAHFAASKQPNITTDDIHKINMYANQNRP